MIQRFTCQLGPLGSRQSRRKAVALYASPAMELPSRQWGGVMIESGVVRMWARWKNGGLDACGPSYTARQEMASEAFFSEARDSGSVAPRGESAGHTRTTEQGYAVMAACVLRSRFRQ